MYLTVSYRVIMNVTTALHKVRKLTLVFPFLILFLQRNIEGQKYNTSDVISATTPYVHYDMGNKVEGGLNNGCSCGVCQVVCVHV